MKPDASAVALALGAVLLWCAWALMPDAATNDAAHILTAVAGARAAVRASAILQLAGAALIVAGLAAEVVEGRRAGVVATLLGGVGMAADAVYHQLAYEMTAPGVARDAVLPVMTKMQTEDLRSLAPLLLLFPVGAVVLGAQRRAIGARWVSRALMAPALTIPLGVLAHRAAGVATRAVALVTIGAVGAGLVGVAVDRARRRA